MNTEEYEKRVQALEDEGCTRSDAQGVVDAENMQSKPEQEAFSAFQNMIDFNSPAIRWGYLPTDNLGRLYCWDCWDRLKSENPRLHNAGQVETCESCQKEMTQS
tara:strand:- start:236 stop:547 length:312 start_codon:yes stop_codon:yes gene_type:complete